MNKLRVYWHNNKRSIYEEVSSIEEAIEWCDRQQEEESVDKSITYNAGGLEVYNSDTEDWVEYYDEYGRDIYEIAEGRS